MFYGDYDCHYWKSLLGLYLSKIEFWNLGYRSAFAITKATGNKAISNLLKKQTLSLSLSHELIEDMGFFVRLVVRY